LHAKGNTITYPLDCRLLTTKPNQEIGLGIPHPKDFHDRLLPKPKQKRKDIDFNNPNDSLEDSLKVPWPYHEYNQRMGFTDQHAQLTASYGVQHTVFHNCWPIFFQMINAAICNAWVATRKLEGKRNHFDFQLELSC
jgi:hypothetical protein